MAYGNPGPKNDMYDDSPEPAQAEDQGGAQTEEKPDDEGGDGQAVLPRSILAGKDFKVGDEVVLEITGMDADRVTVKYAPPKEQEGGKEEEAGESSGEEMSEGMGKGGGGGSEYASMME